MLGRGKASSRAALASTLAVSTDEQPTVEGGGFTQSLYQNPNRFNIPIGDFPVSGINTREVEWIEPDSLDVEVSGLVTNLPTSQSPKKCYRTSTSSGYSSHSPQLSATSLCCVTATPQQGAIGASTTNPFRDQGPGLAVIHEGKTIPRPIWPCLGNDPKNFHYEGCVERNGDMKGAIPCCCYGYAFPHPYYKWDRDQTSGTVAREVLMELSRTLNSVLEGDTSMTPAEILRDITRTINQNFDLNKKTPFEEYIYRNSSSSSGAKDSFPAEMNPINSRVYSKNENYLGVQNSCWTGAHYNCEKNCLSQELFATPFVDQSNLLESDKRKKDGMPEVLLVPENQGFFTKNIHSYNKKNFKNCSCQNANDIINLKSKDGKDSSQLNAEKDKFDLRKDSHVNHEYSMQLNCGEERLSSESNSRSSSKDSWCRGSGIFEKSLDFTLDGSRAERLRRTIEEAKRRRQWCRVIITLFGLVFFILSVVIVSLSVTKGRKIFGSM